MTTAGRQETLRYHRALYADHSPTGPATWLHRPSPFVLRSLPQLHADGPALAVELGAGAGRHTIPVAQALPAGSRVLGVDLLPVAAEQLRTSARGAGVSDVVRPVVADIEAFGISGQADLVVACSALEHVSGPAAFERVLGEWQAATRVNGLHCLVIGVDKTEVHPGGEVRPAAVEFPFGRAEAERLLQRCYSGWRWLEYSVGGFSVTEQRDGTAYRLDTVCVRLLVRRT
ncbi:Methyltransferase type 11 [Kribbella flavida DSM 17836]|uniref:Methyltransferase type 11 n=1 Tax=Kribbella flavida (strain DSM 17836 / JCM 10339 / NBRC 14399) TaxID=479435 RepID=D2PVY2_KRIFD|nr:class I SAM-dependent methyltransferase [Kribbella flavida]ADB29639.1 Methyltransferase type 11 [Kribbella flavida DSM 17836]